SKRPARDSEKIIDGLSVQRRRPKRASVLRSLNKLVQLPCQAATTAGLLFHFDAGKLGRCLGFEQVLGPDSRGQCVTSVFAGVTVDHARAFIGPQLIATFRIFALLAVDRDEARLDPSI